MISRLTGVLSEKAPPFVLVDVNGVGYEVQVPMSTFYNLPELGAKVTLLTQFIVREDAQLLYGFLTPTERASFRELIKISGVGPRIALALLSGLNTEELAQAVAAAERLCERMATTPVEHGGHVLAFTVCVGVSQLVAGDTGAGSLLQRADQALYAAKQAGRNQVASQGI